MHAWTIETDHLGTEDVSGWQWGEIPTGVKGVRFTLYDDDNVRYYSGRFFTDSLDGITEEETYDVLRWGAAHAGAVSMRFPGHPEWDMG